MATTTTTALQDAARQSCVPTWVGTSTDRLVKAGRCLRSLVELADDNDSTNTTLDSAALEASLQLLVDESKLLMSGQVKVPKVAFGHRTDIQMPIVTLGCMRFQEEWGPRIDKMVGNVRVRESDG